VPNFPAPKAHDPEAGAALPDITICGEVFGESFTAGRFLERFLAGRREMDAPELGRIHGEFDGHLLLACSVLTHGNHAAGNFFFRHQVGKEQVHARMIGFLDVEQRPVRTHRIRGHFFIDDALVFPRPIDTPRNSHEDALTASPLELHSPSFTHRNRDARAVPGSCIRKG
jgi:hypothetical protein